MSYSVTQWTTAHQVSLPFIIFQSLLKLMSTELVLTSNHLALCYLLLFLTSKFPGIRGFSNKPCGHSIGASVSASVLPMNIQGWFPLGLTGLVSLHPRDSQESSPMPQFKGINSSVSRFFFFNCPDLTSVHDYWKKQSSDTMDSGNRENLSNHHEWPLPLGWIAYNFCRS